MKYLWILIISSVALIPASAGEPQESPGRAAVTAGREKKTKKVTFSVSMHCENCVKKIMDNVAFEKGVKDLEVSLENRTVTIWYDASRTDEATLAAALEKLGYEVGRVPARDGE